MTTVFNKYSIDELVKIYINGVKKQWWNDTSLVVDEMESRGISHSKLEYMAGYP